MGRPGVLLPRRPVQCAKGGHVCALFMEGHPLDGHSFGVPGTITPLVDLWIKEGRLPDHMRAVPKPDAGGLGDQK